MKKVLAVFLAVFLIMGATTAFAQDEAETQSYLSRAGHVAMDGLKDIVTSPAELVNSDHYDDGAIKGVGKSLLAFVTDLGSGVVNIVGALVPGFDGV